MGASLYLTIMPLIEYIGYGAFAGPWPGNYASTFSVPYSVLPEQGDKIFSVEYGNGAYGMREFVRPLEFERGVDVSGAPEDTIRITFYSRSGGILGRLHTDAPLHILMSAEINYGDGQDCKEAIIKTSVPLPFDVPRFSTVEIKIGDNPVPWYTGQLTELPQPGTSPETPGSGQNEYVYEAAGFSRTMTSLNAEGVYSSGTDLGEIVYDIMTGKADDVTFDIVPGKINRTTGTLALFDLDVSRATLDKVLDIFAQWANCVYGVDGSGDFFWRTVNDEISDTIFVETVGSFTARQDGKIFNSIIVKRQPAAGSGKSGVEPAAIVNDLTSQAKYGISEKTITVTGSYSDDDCELIGQRVLEENAEPRVNASLYGRVIENGFSRLGTGIHRVITSFGDYEAVGQECDSLDSIAVSGTGDLALSIDDEILHDGAGSCRMDFEQAAGQAAVFQLDAVTGAIKTLILWVRSTITGPLIQIGIGNDSWDENLIDVSIPASGRFVPIELDVSELGLSEPSEIAVKVLDDAAVPETIWIDTVKFGVSDYGTFLLRSKRERYYFGPDRKEASVDYNAVPSRLEDYLEGLQDARKTLEFTVDER